VATYRVKIYSIKPDLRYVNGSGRVIVDLQCTSGARSTSKFNHY